MLAKKTAEWKEKSSFRAKSARLAASRLFVQQAQDFLAISLQLACADTVDA